MSRTDKDRPYKIRANDPTTAQRYFWHNDLYHARHGECQTGDSSHWGSCGWEIPYRTEADSPPRDYIRAVWTRPERQRERMELDQMRREYNMTRYLDDDDADFNNRQHRHGAAWHWW